MCCWVYVRHSFAGVPWRGASNDSGVIENVDFQGFGRYVFGTLGNEANIYSIIWSLVAFPLTPKYVTLNGLKWPFYVKLQQHVRMTRDPTVV